MASVKVYIVALVFVIVVTTGQQLAMEQDYPEAELPGVISPGHAFNDIVLNAAPCTCLPQKWQGNMTGQSGMTGGGRGEEEVSAGRGGRRGGGERLRVTSNLELFVNQDAKKLAGKSDAGGRFHNKSGGFIIIFGSDKADLYFFSVDDMKCKHMALKNATFKPQCIPANSTSRDVTLGPATGGLKATAYNFRAKSPQNRRGMRVFVSGTLVLADKCLPVASQDRGMICRGRPHTVDDTNSINFDQSEDDQDVDEPGRRRRGGGVKFMESWYYSNVKDSIDDPTVFDPPKYCNATTPAMTAQDLLLFDDDDSYTEVLEKFVSF